MKYLPYIVLGFSCLIGICLANFVVVPPNKVVNDNPYDLLTISVPSGGVTTSTTTTTTTLVPDIAYEYNFSINETPQTNEIGSAFNMVVDGATFNSGNGGHYIADGINDNMDSATAMPEVSKANNYTISLWMKPNDNTDNYQTAFAVSHGSTDRIVLGTGSDPDVFQFAIYTGSYVLEECDFNHGNDQWYHLAATHTDANGVHLFVNGTNQTDTSGSASTASTVGTTFMNRTSESFQALDGSLDEVRVMSSVLSAANILRLYNKGGETK